MRTGQFSASAFRSLVLSTLFALMSALPSVATVSAQQTQQTRQHRVMTGVRFDGNTSLINVVVEGGPADRAGIKVGDEIVSAGEHFVVQSNDLVKSLQGKEAGDVIVLEIKREDQFHFFQLKLVDAAQGDVVIDGQGRASLVSKKLGVLEEVGPELTVKDWWGIAEGQTTILRKNQGKVICMMFFQSDCNYSLREGLNEYKKIQDQFSGDKDVLVMALQTPFQNHEINTYETARGLFVERGLKGPLGHEGNRHERSQTFDNYKVPGTPWFVVMDKKGVVRYNDSSLPLNEAIAMFDSLKATEMDQTSKVDQATEVVESAEADQ